MIQFKHRNNAVILFSLFTFFFTNSSVGMQRLPDCAVHAPARLGRIAVLHNGQQFAVEDENGFHAIERCWTDSTLRNLKAEHLALFAANGYVQVQQSENGKYSLRSHIRGEGGGPILAQCVYWGIKGIAYGIPAGAALLGIGAALPAITVGGGISSGAAVLGTAAANTAAVTGTTMAMTTAAPAALLSATVAVPTMGVGGVAAASVLAGEAVAATIGVEATGAVAFAAAGATTGGYVGTVETIATLAWAWAMATPTT